MNLITNYSNSSLIITNKIKAKPKKNNKIIKKNTYKGCARNGDFGRLAFVTILNQ